MSKYAKGTSVPVARSREEIERLLTKYGADQLSSGWTEGKAVVMFRAQGRYIKIEMPLPPVGSPNTRSWERQKGVFYSTDAAAAETRRRWRAMLLYIKAKLESVESEIVSFEQAFMAHVLLPNRQTVGEFMAPQITQAYAGGDMPKALPGY